MRCPRDDVPLDRVSSEHATTFACRTCAGRAVTAALLRRMMPVDHFRELWTLVRASKPSDARCPSCARPMGGVAFHEGSSSVQLDGCATCEVVWFDSGELNTIARSSASPAPVLDGPVPADASDEWMWSRFFQVLNDKHFWLSRPDGLT